MFLIDIKYVKVINKFLFTLDFTLFLNKLVLLLLIMDLHF